MRILLLVLASLIVSSCSNEPTVSDRASVVGAIERWDQAWKTKDARLGAQDYSDDAHWVNAFGMRRTGAAAVEQTLKEVFALPFVAAGESQTVGHDIRFLKPDVAVVATSVERRGQLTPDGKQLGVRHTSHLRVFQRREGKWQIVSHLISDARDRQAPRH